MHRHDEYVQRDKQLRQRPATTEDLNTVRIEQELALATDERITACRTPTARVGIAENPATLDELVELLRAEKVETAGVEHEAY